MTNIKLTLVGATAHAQVEGELTAGMVGVPVTIQCDSAWDGLTKTLVCRSSVGTRSVVGVDEQGMVAPEVLKRSKWGRNELFLGLEGRRADGSLALASTMAFCKKILPGAAPEKDLSAVPENPVWMQIMNMIGRLKNLKTCSRGNLVDAINEVVADVQTNREQIPQAVKDFLKENPEQGAVGITSVEIEGGAYDGTGDEPSGTIAKDGVGITGIKITEV